jgi:hypothetical protein
VHPDDVELGCAGTYFKEISLGKTRNNRFDTRELGTRGSAEIRDQEANCRCYFRCFCRENLEMRDGFCAMTKTPIGNHKNDSQIPTRNCLV